MKKNRFTEHQLRKMVHDYRTKCMENIFVSKTDEQLDTSINLSNTFGHTITSILNYCDYPFLGSHFNWHRPWCSRIYELLSESLRELDAAVQLKKTELSNHTSTGRLGF